jgi:hypothetical protein
VGQAQVNQDLARHGRRQDAGDDLAPGAALAAQEFQIECALHELGPAQTSVEAHGARRTGAGSNAVGGARDHVVPEGGRGGQDAVVGDLVGPGPGDQGAESLEEGIGCEDDVRAAVRVGVAQAQEDAALLIERVA